MKYYIFALFYLQFAVISYSQVEKTYDSKKDRKKFYSDLISNYASTDVKYIWETDKNEKFDTWVDGTKESELIDEFETVIHELFHGICKTHDEGQDYYINKDITIFVPYTKVFNSKELNAVVRKGQQDSIYRYGLYVGGKNQLPTGVSTNLINTNASNEVSSIQDGMYGLLEEFTAYYFSTLTSYPLYTYFEEKFGKEDEDAWYDYRHLVEGTVVAYYEFHFFMGNYLVYAKKNQPDVYKGLMDNKALRVVYTLVEKRFRKVIGLYNENLENIPQNSANDLVEQMDFSGSDEDIALFALMAGIPEEQIYSNEYSEEDGIYKIRKKIILSDEYLEALKPEYDKYIPDIKKQMQGDIFFFYASPSKQYNYLNKQITAEMDEELEKLLLEGCDDSSYKTFLK